MATDLDDFDTRSLAERRLLSCLLMHALCEIGGYAADTNLRDEDRERLSKQAKAWIFSKITGINPKTGFTFLGVCEALDIDAYKIRKVVLAECIPYEKLREMRRGRPANLSLEEDFSFSMAA